MIRSDVQRLGPGERASSVTRGGARSDIDDELVIIQSERNCSTSPFLVSLSLSRCFITGAMLCGSLQLFISVSRLKSQDLNPKCSTPINITRNL